MEGRPNFKHHHFLKRHLWILPTLFKDDMRKAGQDYRERGGKEEVEFSICAYTTQNDISKTTSETTYRSSWCSKVK